jgi:crotonobetainyl-CoA:carnitine CoA-transferase CaiB-like acyl-CoA transferase
MKKSTDQNSAALAGVKVLDLSRVLAGPSATQTLGDLGADVVKVEHPHGGDDTRSWGPPFVEDDAQNNVETSYFACCNRNKRSVTLDFKNPEDLNTLKSLAQRADILVENFRPGGLAKYGLDYEHLSAINPSLIYCSITGFGQTGPYAHRPGYDFLMQGMGGLMSITGHAEDHVGGEPMKVGVAICDLFTGLNAVTAILAALQFRHRTGEGQHIDCALLDNQVAMLANQSSNWLNSGVTPRRMGNHHPSIVPYQVFTAQDGHLIINCGNDGQFQRLCTALDDPEIATDQRFVHNEARCANRGELERILNAKLKTRPVAEVITLLEAVNVPCGPINDIPSVFADDHLRSRRVEVSLKREDGVSFASVAYPPKLSKSPARYLKAPPQLGAHNAEVSRDWAINHPDKAPRS